MNKGVDLSAIPEGGVKRRRERGNRYIGLLREREEERKERSRGKAEGGSRVYAQQMSLSILASQDSLSSFSRFLYGGNNDEKESCFLDHRILWSSSQHGT